MFKYYLSIVTALMIVAASCGTDDEGLQDVVATNVTGTVQAAAISDAVDATDEASTNLLTALPTAEPATLPSPAGMKLIDRP